MAWRMSTGLKNAILSTAGLKQALASGQIRIFGGSQPNSADDAEQGPLLCTITLNGGTMTSGLPTNGINIGIASNGQVGKATGEVWSGVNAQDGTAGWFRWYPNAFTANSGVDTTGTKIRIDGDCGTLGSQMILTSVALRAGVSTTIDNLILAI